MGWGAGFQAGGAHTLKSSLWLGENRLERVRSRFGEPSAVAKVRKMCMSVRLSFKVTPLDGARPGSLWHETCALHPPLFGTPLPQPHILNG